MRETHSYTALRTGVALSYQAPPQDARKSEVLVSSMQRLGGVRLLINRRSDGIEHRGSLPMRIGFSRNIHAPKAPAFPRASTMIEYTYTSPDLLKYTVTFVSTITVNIDV